MSGAIRKMRGCKPVTLGVRWRAANGSNSYVVRVPHNACTTSGRRWYAIANSLGLGYFKSKRNAVAAVYKAITEAEAKKKVKS